MTRKIKTQIKAVAETGRTNRFDAGAVQIIANERHFSELVLFIDEHRQEYGTFILTGKFKG